MPSIECTEQADRSETVTDQLDRAFDALDGRGTAPRPAIEDVAVEVAQMRVDIVAFVTRLGALPVTQEIGNDISKLALVHIWQ